MLSIYLFLESPDWHPMPWGITKFAAEVKLIPIRCPIWIRFTAKEHDQCDKYGIFYKIINCHSHSLDRSVFFN